ETLIVHLSGSQLQGSPATYYIVLSTPPLSLSARWRASPVRRRYLLPPAPPPEAIFWLGHETAQVLKYQLVRRDPYATTLQPKQITTVVRWRGRCQLRLAATK